MYLKNDRIVVTIKNTQFRSFRSGTAPQFVLDPVALVGWDDGVNVRRDATVRPVSNGDFTEPYTMSSRLISITGAAIGKDRRELQYLRDVFTGLLAPNEYAEISVQTSAGIRYATVGLEGTPSFSQQLDHIAAFKLDLYAPDPHLYGVEKRQKAGSYLVAGGLEFPLSYPLDYHQSEDFNYAVISNNGNAPSYPKFEVIGDFYSGFTISDRLGGNAITYTGMVTRQSPLIIDTEKGTATQGGVDKTVHVTRRDWFSIPPNETLSPVFSPLGGDDSGTLGWCDIIYRDTWI